MENETSAQGEFLATDYLVAFVVRKVFYNIMLVFISIEIDG